MTEHTRRCQAHLSMGFSKQEYWSELPFPSPGYLPDPKIKPSPMSPASQVNSLPIELSGKPMLSQVFDILLRIYLWPITWSIFINE